MEPIQYFGDSKMPHCKGFIDGSIDGSPVRAGQQTATRSLSVSPTQNCILSSQSPTCLALSSLTHIKPTFMPKLELLRNLNKLRRILKQGSTGQRQLLAN